MVLTRLSVGLMICSLFTTSDLGAAGPARARMVRARDPHHVGATPSGRAQLAQLMAGQEVAEPLDGLIQINTIYAFWGRCTENLRARYAHISKCYLRRGRIGIPYWAG